MKDPVYERLREASWRRELTLAEQELLRSHLSEHPEEALDLESERQLTQALGRLPDAPVPSNFTVRVVRQVERELQTPDARGIWWRVRWRIRWLPRMAVATVMLAAGLISYQHLQHSRRAERAESVKEIVAAAAFPGPEILQDYDAIQALSQSPSPDVELLKALQ